MKIIIIGATGLIGRKLVEHLTGKNYQVVIVSRNAAKAKNLFPNQNDLAEWDGRSVEILSQIVSGSNAVINLAGESIAGGRWTDARKQKILGSRVNSTKAVVMAINGSAQKPGVLLQGSAIGYYGAHPSKIFTEKDSAGSGFLAEVSQKWESAAAELDPSVRLVFLRTGVVLDPQGGALKQMQTPFKFGIGGHIGSGEQWFSWIHMDDEIRAIAFLLENPQSKGAFNLTAPQPVSMKDFAQAIGRAMKRPSLLHVPSFAIKILMGKMGEEIVLNGQKVIPEKLLDEGFQFRYEKVADALQGIYQKTRIKR